MKKLTTDEILELAYKENIFEVVFDMQLSINYIIKVKLKYFGIYEIWWRQRKILENLKKKYKIEETDEDTEGRLRIESETEAIIGIILEKLVNPETGEILFKEDGKLKKIKEIVKKNNNLTGLLIEKYEEISKIPDRVRNNVKKNKRR